MRRRLIGLLALAGALNSQAPGHELTDNPVLAAVQSIGTTGLSTRAAPPSSPTAFKRETPSTTLQPLLKEFLDDPEERKAVAGLVDDLTTRFDEQVKGHGLGSDAAGGIAFAMTLLSTVVMEKTIDDAGFLALGKALQATLDRPEVRGATDRQRQEVFELSMLTAAVTLLASSVDTPEGKQRAKAVAATMLRVLTGVTPEGLKVSGRKLQIVVRARAAAPAGGSPASPASTSGLAPGLTFSVPAGWVARDGWNVREKIESRWEGHREVTTAQVRFLPAMKPEGNMGAALGRLWKQAVPAEGAETVSAMVYRRYVGDGLFGQFVSGVFKEKGRDTYSAFTLMLLDCKSHWQPLVIAQTYDENTPIRSTVTMFSRSSFPTSADLAEELLSTIRCPSAKGVPIATVESLAGEYTFGTTSTLWLENVNTGATSMNYVAYGGTLHLKPDRTFVWKWGSSSAQYGVKSTGRILATGKWSIQGDVLHVVYETYDQGDSYKAVDRRYKIAGITTFSDGKKAAVLMSDWKRPTNATTVGDRGDWYVTK